ncbi:type II toxin-antitoxin system VapB family antitoxin [Ferrovibrio sp.]|uniref:type II toxin-antitoxin system VapB family antitoxin n=1 Tax=Ferrovibrio sp. TaxID=1917215 RepID=UPI001B5DD66A|nr:type II toxin-antitoxin system VapB family antitoxin [Ferrovibrio sp.]MBP7066374.1 type II toxin-antitoxin system VapB family antitoxin [Ferrovibrio sp.]
MGLNINSDGAERLISELAMMQGESLTEPVTAAVRERLERLKRENQLAALLEIGWACAAALPPQPDQLESDPTAFLYDEMGLPK